MAPAGADSFLVERSVVVGAGPEAVHALVDDFHEWPAWSPVTTFLFEPGGTDTTVRWQMTGKKTWFFKVFGFVFSMDKMVGKDFEKGLAKLEAAAEAR
ncbi:hypothetical protein [Rhodococcus sp. NPDC059234]|uniref:hypothetical protein n=1 Tax=Rhodococcus sp. NPDC059234 TaxID=3346781 RepID=UPI003670B053